MRHCIPVLCIEFDDDGHTLWVQGEHGTVLRLKTLDGKITSETCKTSGSHSDGLLSGDLKVCLGTGESEA